MVLSFYRSCNMNWQPSEKLASNWKLITNRVSRSSSFRNAITLGKYFNHQLMTWNNFSTFFSLACFVPIRKNNLESRATFLRARRSMLASPTRPNSISTCARIRAFRAPVGRATITSCGMTITSMLTSCSAWLISYVTPTFVVPVPSPFRLRRTMPISSLSEPGITLLKRSMTAVRVLFKIASRVTPGSSAIDLFFT